MDELEKKEISRLKKIWNVFIEKISGIKKRQNVAIENFAKRIEKEKIKNLKKNINKM